MLISRIRPLNWCNFMLFSRLGQNQTFLKFFICFCRYQYCEGCFVPRMDLGGIQYIVVMGFQAKIWMLSPEIHHVR